MNFFLKKYLHEEDGATAVEFGIVSILFLSFLFGIVETARIMWTWNGLQYAVGQAARYALTQDDPVSADVTDYTQTSLASMQVSPDPLVVTVTRTSVDGNDMIEVSSSYELDLLLPLPGNLQSITLNNRASLALAEE